MVATLKCIINEEIFWHPLSTSPYEMEELPYSLLWSEIHSWNSMTFVHSSHRTPKPTYSLIPHSPWPFSTPSLKRSHVNNLWQFPLHARDPEFRVSRACVMGGTINWRIHLVIFTTHSGTKHRIGFTFWRQGIKMIEDLTSILSDLMRNLLYCNRDLNRSPFHLPYSIHNTT